MNQTMFSGLRTLGAVRLVAVSPVAIPSPATTPLGLSRHRNATTTASAANVKPVDLSEGGRNLTPSVALVKISLAHVINLPLDAHWF